MDESGKRGTAGVNHLFPAALLLRFDDLLDDLGLLHQECPKDPWIWIENVRMMIT